MTGWGQSGPLAASAGHDIGYIAITGALGAIGRAGEVPVPPVHFLGDFGCRSAFLVMGVLASVREATRSGKGQVVDAAIVDGASSLTGILHGLMAAGQWTDRRGANFLDSGVPWYATSDGQWMAAGALEPKFYAELMQLLGLGDDVARLRRDPSHWPDLRTAIAGTFASKTRAEWTAVFDGTDACVAPADTSTVLQDWAFPTSAGSLPMACAHVGRVIAPHPSVVPTWRPERVTSCAFPPSGRPPRHRRRSWRLVTVP